GPRPGERLDIDPGGGTCPAERLHLEAVVVGDRSCTDVLRDHHTQRSRTRVCSMAIVNTEVRATRCANTATRCAMRDKTLYAIDIGADTRVVVRRLSGQPDDDPGAAA